MSAKAESLAGKFGFLTGLMDLIVGDFSAEDWARTPERGGNHAHWLVGHLAFCRRTLARKLGADAEPDELRQDFDTGVTLRQLFYRLVSYLLIPNTKSAYTVLSSRTAEARREGNFPAFIDNTREIDRPWSFGGPEEATDWLVRAYRRDRTEGQEYSIYLGVEKRGIVEQLRAWFGHDLGIPILALGGYSSQTYIDEIRSDVRRQARPGILLYAGDFDPSGEDIIRDFEERLGCFQEVRRIALTAEQVEEYDLPPQMGKATDTRASAFIARHGRLVQVELDALPPDTLRGLYQEALDDFWDEEVYEEVLQQERGEREELRKSA